MTHCRCWAENMEEWMCGGREGEREEEARERSCCHSHVARGYALKALNALEDLKTLKAFKKPTRLPSKTSKIHDNSLKTRAHIHKNV